MIGGPDKMQRGRNGQATSQRASDPGQRGCRGRERTSRCVASFSGAAVHGVTAHRGSVGRWLHRLGLSHKKTLRASEILWPEVAERRRVWIEICQPDMANMLERLVFIDDNVAQDQPRQDDRLAPVGKRLIDHASFGHWHTQTFIRVLNCMRVSHVCSLTRILNIRAFIRVYASRAWHRISAACLI